MSTPVVPEPASVILLAGLLSVTAFCRGRRDG